MLYKNIILSFKIPTVNLVNTFLLFWILTSPFYSARPTQTLNSHLKEKSYSEVNDSQKKAMKKSKLQISLILNSFSDSEGAVIKKIQTLQKNYYKVDILTKSGICIGSKVRILNSILAFDARRYNCD